MKKQLLFTLSIIISLTTYSYTYGACTIKDKSAQVLLNYIKDNRVVIKNVTDAIIKESNKEKPKDSVSSSINNQISRSINETVNIFNNTFNYRGYYSYAEYFSKFPISNEVPFQVKRDYKILDQENKGLFTYLMNIDDKLNGDIIVVDACKGVENKNKCELRLNNKTAKKIVGDLIYNNDQILDLFRLSVMGKANEFKSKDLILVNNDFILEIKKNYSTESIKLCSKEEGGFFEQISTSISEIQLLNKQGKDGIEKWKEAWKLLVGDTSKDEESKKIEKKELAGELSSKGVSMDNQKILQSNLSKYNIEGVNENDNFLTNTISSTFGKIDEKLEFWKEEVVGDFFDKKKETININELKKVTDNSKISQDIQERITTLYEKEVPFTAIGDIVTENIRAKIIKTHMSLDDSIKTLDETIDLSQKVCKSQATGKGSCN